MVSVSDHLATIPVEVFHLLSSILMNNYVAFIYNYCYISLGVKNDNWSGIH